MAGKVLLTVSYFPNLEAVALKKVSGLAYRNCLSIPKMAGQKVENEDSVVVLKEI